MQSGNIGFFNSLPWQWQLPVLVVTLLLAHILFRRVTKHKAAFDGSKKILAVTLIGLPIFVITMQLLTLGIHFGVMPNLKTNIVPFIFVHLTIIAFGNYIGTSRPAWFTGLPTPWTLGSRLSWAKTHRLLGVGFVVLGVVSFTASTASGNFTAQYLWCGLIGLILFCSLYSYFIWKDDPDKKPAVS